MTVPERRQDASDEWSPRPVACPPKRCPCTERGPDIRTRVLPGLVPLEAGDPTAPSCSDQADRISLTASNEGSSRYPRTVDPGPAVVPTYREPRRYDAGVTPLPLRTQVRHAVERAWARAVDDGAVPALGDDARPAIEVERPADPHPRRLRHEPGDEARSAVPPPTAGARDTLRRQARPGRLFAGCVRERGRLPDRGRRGRPSWLPQHADPTRRHRGDRRRRPRRPRRVGACRAHLDAEGQRRVRVGQPDGAAHDRQCPRRIHRRPAEPRPRGRRSARHARVLLQRRGGPDRPTSGRRSSPSATGEPVPEDGYHGDYVETLAQRVPGRRVGRARRRPGPDGGCDRRALGGRPRCGKGSRPASSSSACISTSGRPRGPSTRAAGSSGRSIGYESAVTSTRRTAPLWFRIDRLRRRQGSRHLPVQRPADVLRGRHRLRRRRSSAAASTTSSTSGAPTTTGRSRECATPRRRWATTSTRSRCCCTVGPLRARRRGDLDVEAGRRVHHARRAARRGRRRRRALVLRHPRRERQRSTSTSSWRRSSRTRTRSTTCSTRTRGSRRSCARPPTRGSPAPARSRARSADGPEATLARQVVRLPEVVEDAVVAEETQGITAYATELATAFHAFYRDARVVDPDEPAALGDAARPRSSDPADTSLANARAARDLRARVDVRRPSRRGPGRWRPSPSAVSSLPTTTQRVVPPSPGMTPARPAGLAGPPSLPRSLRTPRRPRRCPSTVCQAIARPRSGRSTARSGRRPSPSAAAVAAATRSGAQPDRRLVLAERVLARRLPARAQPRGEVVGQVDGDGRLAARGTSRDGGPARSTGAGRRSAASTACQPPASWMPTTNVRALRGREQDLRGRTPGCRSSAACASGSCDGPRTSADLLGRQVLLQPVGHERRRHRPRPVPGARAPHRSGRRARPGACRGRSAGPAARGAYSCE